jgi:hypothetical protein
MSNLLEISFTDSNYGITKIHPDNLKEEIKKHIDRHGVENVFVNGKLYLGSDRNYETD